MSLEGDGGGTIVIDPLSLRRAGSRLKAVASELQTASHSIAGDGLPAMPANVSALVQQVLAELVDTVGTVPPGLEATVVELTRRAFWAEYADRIMGGYPLTGPAKQEFESYLRDGTLLKYLDPVEAEKAGEELARVSGDFRKDQTQLFLVAAALQGAERSGSPNLKDFCAGFVTQFVPKNMLQVPRVIQAMEWSRAITFTNDPMEDPHLLKDVARTWTDTKLPSDPLKDLLAPFGIALANATMSGRLTRAQEDDIADSDDQWAVAALVSQGNTFDTHFLVDCFNKGVVQKIADDSRYYSMRNISGEPPAVDPYAIGRMWSEGNGGLPVDTKQIILDALARNPHAAVAALQQDVSGVQLFDRFGNETTAADPVSLIYRYGHFDDHGASLSHAYTAAADQLRADGDFQGENTLTLSVANNVVNHASGGMSAVTGGLADDLANHHIADLHWAAASKNVSDLSHGAFGWTDPSEDSMIHLTHEQLENVLAKAIDAGPASSRFLASAAQYQAHQIAAGTAAVPSATGDFSWAHRAGSFDQALMNAGDMNRLDDFHHAEERQKLVVGFLNDVTKLVDVNPVAGIAIDHGIDAISDQLAPSAEQLTAQNDNAHAVIQNSLAAAVAKGYADHGHIDLAGASHYGLVHDGKLDNYADLDALAKSRYEEWLGNDSSVNRMLHEALQDAWRP